MKADLEIAADILPERYSRRIAQVDAAIIAWLEQWSVTITRIALGLTFIWFGALKPFGLSPAGDFVAQTVFFLPPSVFLPILGAWEVLIGICLLYRPLIRVGLFLMAVQMAGTFMPLFILPEAVFTAFPYALTIEGQYVIKNLVLIAAGIFVGSSVNRIQREKEEGDSN